MFHGQGLATRRVGVENDVHGVKEGAFWRGQDEGAERVLGAEDGAVGVCSIGMALLPNGHESV